MKSKMRSTTWGPGNCYRCHRAILHTEEEHKRSIAVADVADREVQATIGYLVVAVNGDGEIDLTYFNPDAKTGALQVAKRLACHPGEPWIGTIEVRELQENNPNPRLITGYVDGEEFGPGR